MELVVLPQALKWPADAARWMRPACHDWHGRRICPPPSHALIEDPTHLWLVAGRDHPFQAHPAAECGTFQAELWCHDVAELFIASPRDGHYLEFNLAPSGAWWMAAFDGPRQRRTTPDLPLVITHGTPSPADVWRAALAIPLDWLRRHAGWSHESRLNLTLILGTEPQHFVSACDLGGGEPDFHRPQRYPRVRRRPAEKD